MTEQLATDIVARLYAEAERMALVPEVSDLIAELAARVPDRLGPAAVDWPARLSRVFSDQAIFNVGRYPAALWKQPGNKAPNRRALAASGTCVNGHTRKLRQTIVRRLLGHQPAAARPAVPGIPGRDPVRPGPLGRDDRQQQLAAVEERLVRRPADRGVLAGT